MKPVQKRSILSLVIIFTMIVSILTLKADVKATSNEFDTAKEISPDKKITGFQDGKDVYWYKFNMKKAADRSNIKIILMGKSDFNGSLYMDIYYSSGELMRERHLLERARANDSLTMNFNITDGADNENTFAKGNTYYFKVYSSYSGTSGDYTLLVTGDKKIKSTKLSVSAKKNKKNISISTIANAKVTVSVNQKFLLNKKKKVKKINVSSKKGSVKINLSRKLKKGDKITVTVKKSGYKTKKVTKKI